MQPWAQEISLKKYFWIAVYHVFKIIFLTISIMLG